MRRTTLITGLLAAALASLAVAPFASAEPRTTVTRVEVFSAAQRQAEKSAATVEKDASGAVTIDRSLTSVGNYLRYGVFRKSASFAIFGTKTVDGVAHTLWCIGNVEVTRTKKGHTRSRRTLTCVGA
jgi:hypothetical protein